MALPSGSWEGSSITDEDIERLRRIPPQVKARAPGDEVVPQLEPGERVVFTAHFERWLGRPASAFFRYFLDYFGLQPHHLPANAFITLSCYVAFCEGYAGLWPGVDFWSRLFFIKAQTIDGRLRACGAASLYLRPSTPFPRIPTVDSVKKWQTTFFYVKSENPSFDWVNLPEFSPEPPTAKLNWGHCAKPDDVEAEKFARQQVEDGDLLQKIWTADHVDPADQAGDDESPEAAEQAAQGHDDPPPSPQQEEEQGADAPTSSAPLRVVPISVRPPAASSSAPKGRKRTTAQIEAALKKQRRMGPKPVPEAAGAAIKFTKGAGSGPTSDVVSPPPLQRWRREPTPQPPPRACTPPTFPPPATGAGSSSAPPPSASGSSSQGEPARRAGQPTIDDLFPRRRPLGPAAGAGGTAPEGPAAGAGGAVPEVVVLDARSSDAPLPPAQRVELQRLRLRSRLERSRRVHPMQTPERCLGSAGTMEKAWRDADMHEVTSRDGNKGNASMEMFFSDFRAFAKASAAEADNRLTRVEKVNRSVTYKRTVLYNRLVASYHKAKGERADMARELELEEDLRAARAQCTESEKAVQAAAAKAQETEGELTRLRRLEANHLAELAAVKRVEQEKVDDLSRRLDEVDGQCRKLHDEVSSKSEELTATAKRWVAEISALDRGLAAAFPEAQQAALDAAGRAREARRQATGEESSPHFSMDDYLVSMAARVEPITMLGLGMATGLHPRGECLFFPVPAFLGYELRQATEELYRLLWPTETLPGDLANLIKWLENAPDRLLD
ncbi:hypothetical protein QYE76_012654 [Lolium multiflorum]|uniref:Transposase (putative) gypsy type domain-containing protein n=1 Tax=Lolium multiflorum TaxID=4521 RepID=A0AAD8X6H2_LOLMU|nr:hypothetical protein QYE76_012654 [Lolium multiflorum]